MTEQHTQPKRRPREWRMLGLTGAALAVIALVGAATANQALAEDTQRRDSADGVCTRRRTRRTAPRTRRSRSEDEPTVRTAVSGIAALEAALSRVVPAGGRLRPVEDELRAQPRRFTERAGRPDLRTIGRSPVGLCRGDLLARQGRGPPASLPVQRHGGRLRDLHAARRLGRGHLCRPAAHLRARGGHRARHRRAPDRERRGGHAGGVSAWQGHGPRTDEGPARRPHLAAGVGRPEARE